MKDKDKLKKLVDLYNKTEKDIEKELLKLPRHGQRCICGDRTIFRQIDVGDTYEIIETCLNCGGYIES